MLGSTVLDVAIGMVFVFLLLSLIASTIHELLATIVQARSANLFRGMLSLFSSGTFAPEISFVQKIYSHGLIQGLYRDPSDTNIGAHRKAKRPPAGVEAYRPSALRRVLQWLMRVEPVDGFDWITDPLLLPSYIPSRTFALALIDTLNVRNDKGQKPMGKELVANVQTFLLTANRDHADNKAIEALLALAVDAGDSIGRLQANLEDWYNDAMDRASGWYKKNTQYVLLGIGLLLSVGLNVNAIDVARTLWFDRDVRQSMVDAAGKMQEQARLASPPVAADSPHLTQRLEDDVKAFRLASEPLLPVGWDRAQSRLLGEETQTIRQRVLRVFSVIAGWMMTAIAISLGAPFWFDLLNKFMVVRNTVKPQEKSQIENSKDGAPDAKPAS